MIEKSNFTMYMPGRVIAGSDSLNQMVELVNSFQAKNVLFVTGQSIWNSGLVDKPIKLLTDAGIKIDIVNDIPKEPEIGQVENLVNRCRKFKSDMVICVGGGSSMDTAKIISVLMKSSFTVKEIMDNPSIIEKGIPTLMVPTTSGTGAEATPNAIVTVPELGLKVGIVSRYFVPDLVILDPLLTIKLPADITAATGMDALAHAIECFISKKANPYSDMLALKAIKLINRNLLKVFDEGENQEARFDMLLASFYGGMCISSSSTTAVHALAYPLGGRYKIAHGISNAILLPYVMEYNKDMILDKLVEIAEAMEIEVNDKSKEVVADEVIDRFFYLSRKLNIPSNLNQFGITEGDINIMVEEASKVTRLLDNNPKNMTKDDIALIYKKLLLN